MRAELDPNLQQITVVLSRRNLQTLLAKLDGAPANSAMTIFTEDGIEPFDRLVVIAEDDIEHYGHRDPPGAMHPETEAKMKEGE